MDLDLRSVLSQLDLFLNVHTHWNHLESLKKKIQCFIQPASRPNASESLGVGPGHQDWLQPPWWL